MPEWYEELPENWDWTKQPPGMLAVGYMVFADQSFFEDDDGDRMPDIFQRAENELKASSSATVIVTGGADPYVGAGGTALQVALQFAGYAADVIALGTFFLSVKPKLLNAIRTTQKLLATLNSPRPSVALSATALQVLVVADLVERESLDPDTIDKVECLMHSGRPAEPSQWLRPSDAAYTITVTAYRDGFSTCGTTLSLALAISLASRISRCP